MLWGQRLLARFQGHLVPQTLPVSHWLVSSVLMKCWLLSVCHWAAWSPAPTPAVLECSSEPTCPARKELLPQPRPPTPFTLLSSEVRGAYHGEGWGRGAALRSQAPPGPVPLARTETVPSGPSGLRPEPQAWPFLPISSRCFIRALSLLSCCRSLIPGLLLALGPHPCLCPPFPCRQPAS